MISLSLSLLLSGWAVPPPPPDTPVADDAGTPDAALEPAPEPEPSPAPAPEPEAAPEAAPLQPRPGPRTDELDLDPYGEQSARDPRRGRGLRITGTVVNGVGVGLLASAGVLVVLRHRSVNDLRDAASDPDPGARETAIAEIEQRERLAIVFAIAGAATVVVGTTLWALGIRERRKATRAQARRLGPAIGGTAFGLRWEGSF